MISLTWFSGFIDDEKSKLVMGPAVWDIIGLVAIRDGVRAVDRFIPSTIASDSTSLDLFEKKTTLHSIVLSYKDYVFLY